MSKVFLPDRAHLGFDCRIPPGTRLPGLGSARAWASEALRLPPDPPPRLAAYPLEPLPLFQAPPPHGPRPVVSRPPSSAKGWFVLDDFVEGVRGQGRQEPTGASGQQLTGHTPEAHPGQVQTLLRAGDGVVSVASLLFDGAVIGQTAVVGEDPLFHTGDENLWEFQSFGGVDRHQRDGAFLRVVAVDVRL